MMEFFKENYRVFDKCSFIFDVNVPSPRVVEILGKETIQKKIEDVFTPDDYKRMREMEPEERTEFLKQKLEKLKPEAWESQLREETQDFAKKVDPQEYEAQIRKAREAYERVYNIMLTRLFRHAENTDAIEEFHKKITEETRKQWGYLMVDIQKKAKAEETVPNLENVATPAEKGDWWPYQIPIAGPIFRNDIPIIGIFEPKKYREYKKFQLDNNGLFRDFVKARNDKYFGNLQYLSTLPGQDKKDYDALVSKFRKGMDENLKNQLEDIYRKSKDYKTLKANLESLRDNLMNAYKLYDPEGNGFITLGELKELNSKTQGSVDLFRLINSTDEKDKEELEKKLKALDFDLDARLGLSKVMADMLIGNAAQNVSEERFIAAVNKVTGENNKGYYAAEKRLRDFMDDKAKLSIGDVLDAAREFNREVNGEIAKILSLDSIEPKEIRPLVRRQYELIKSGELFPPNIDDRTVAEFMSGPLVIRYQILHDPVRRQSLFQSIKNIKQYYPDYFNKERGNKKVFKPNSMNPGNSNSDEELARYPAMLILAKEAEQVIKNMDSGKSMENEMDNIKPEAVPPSPDKKFRSADKLYRIGYQSRAEAGGFNGRDVALGALKIWAGMTLVINYMNARKRAEGKGLDPWIKAAGEMGTNPYFLGFGALLYGAHRVQKNPEFLGYLSADAGGKEKILTNDALTNIAKKIGNRNQVFAFISSYSEFKAIEKLTGNGANSGKINQLIKKANERAAKQNTQREKLIQRLKMEGRIISPEAKKKIEPAITKDDLKGHLDVEYWSQVPDFSNDRMRFLFYEKFLTSPRNIRQLRDNCDKWH